MTSEDRRAPRVPAWLIEALLIAIPVLGLVFVATKRHAVLSGDPYGIYFPVAQALSAGDGGYSFGALWLGPGKMPGFSTLLSVAGLFTGDLIIATQITNIASAAVILGVMSWILRRAGAHRATQAAALFLTASNPVFSRMAFEGLPDMVCHMGIALMVLFLLLEQQSLSGEAAPKSWIKLVLAGVAGAFTSLTRLNGAAVLPAGILAIATGGPPARLRRVATFTLGLFVALAVGTFLISAFLADQQIAVPHFFVQGIDDNIGTATGWRSLATFIWIGAFDSPLRITWTMYWPIAPLGFLVLCIAAFKYRRKDALTAFWVLLMMTGPLVPLHFEARYYLYAVPILTACCAIGFQKAAERLRLPAWAWISVLVALAGYQTAAQSMTAVAEARAATDADRPIQQFGETLARTQRALKRPLVMGIDVEFFTYERLRYLPIPLVDPLPIVVVPAKATDAGLDYWIERHPDAAAPAESELAAAMGDRRIFRLKKESPLPSTSVAGKELLTEPWVRDAPQSHLHNCEERKFRQPPGTYRARAVFTSDPPLWVKVELISGVDKAVAWGGGQAEWATETDVLITESGSLKVLFCFAEPLLSSGLVYLRSLSLRRLDVP